MHDDNTANNGEGFRKFLIFLFVDYVLEYLSDIMVSMKIFIICSKAFYDKVPPIKKELEEMGHETILPNSLDNPDSEKEAWQSGNHAEFKSRMYQESRDKVSNIDAVLTLNFEKNGVKNYIGGCTFLELYDAFMLGKKIYLWNDIPEGILFDEIHGFAPITIHGDLKKIF